MSQPNPPVPGAPAFIAPAVPAPEPEPATGAPSPPADPPPADPAPPPAPAPTDADLAALPELAQKLIREARAEASKARTTAKANAAAEAKQQLAQELAGVLGLGGDEPVDPATLVQHAQTAAWAASLELATYKAARRLGADADALLDSRKFLEDLDDLVDVDPSAPEFAQQLEAAITAAVERDSRYKSGGTAPAAGVPRPDPTQGPRGTPGVDIDARMAEAQKKGDYRTFLTLQEQKFATRRT